ncbi:MAG: hypothetical protein S4CHLAM20_11450 [Chlamydiia bacterium]|nr:hypothetical protein [Chlamydiia bacterium]
MIRVIQIGFCPTQQKPTIPSPIPSPTHSTTPSPTYFSEASSTSSCDDSEETIGWDRIYSSPPISTRTSVSEGEGYDRYYRPVKTLVEEHDKSVLKWIKDRLAENLPNKNTLSDDQFFEGCEELISKNLNEILTDIGFYFAKNFSTWTQGKFTLYKADEDLKVFSINKGNLVFKMSTDKDKQNDIVKRFNNIQMAQEVCEELKLNAIKIPKSKLITIERDGVEYKIIAQEKIVFSPNNGLIDYWRDGKRLNDQGCWQLATFLCETRFCDYKNDNIVLLDDGRIAMLDLEDLNYEIKYSCLSIFQLINLGYSDIAQDNIRLIAQEYSYPIDNLIEISRGEYDWEEPNQRHTRCPNIIKKYNE